MGDFINLKLETEDFAGKNIQTLEGNTFNGQADTLKALFDSAAQVVVKKALNDLLDLLESTDAAAGIGAAALSAGSGTTIGSQLAYLKEQIAAAITGTLPDGSVTDAKLSDAAGEIKDRLSTILTAIDGKAPLASPSFTGSPKATTPAEGDNSTNIATTAYVRGALGLADAHMENAGIHVTTELKQGWSGHAENTENPHGVTAAQVGAVPTARTVNGKALSSDIALTAEDVGAMDGECVTLWSGQSHANETLNLSEAYTDYKFIEIQRSTNGNFNAPLYFSADDIVQNRNYELSSGVNDKITFTSSIAVNRTFNFVTIYSIRGIK